MSLYHLELIWMFAYHIVMLNIKFSEMLYEYHSQEWMYLYQYRSDSNDGIFEMHLRKQIFATPIGRMKTDERLMSYYTCNNKQTFSEFSMMLWS
jgi:hypothetical protein